MKPQALLLLVFLAVLGGVAWFVFEADAAPPPAVGAPRDGGGDGAPGAAQPARAAGDGAAAHGAAGEHEAARTAAPQLAADAGEGGAPMVRARLVDGDGLPRAGVEVAMSTWREEVLDVDGVVAEPRDGGRQTVATDVDGRFAVRVPAGVSGTFSLPDYELVFEQDVQFRGSGSDQELGDLVVLRSGRLSGVVQDEQGRPLADVRVDANLGALGFASQSSTKTDRDGAFSVGKLRPGKWLLRTASSRFLPALEELELGAGERRDGVVLVLAEGLTVAGRVVDDRGVGVADMKVVCQRAERIGAVDVQRFSADEATTTDAQGNFTLAGLAGAKVVVRAYGDGHTSVTVPDVATGTTNLELRVERLARIRGELVTVDGAPIAGSKVSWSAAEPRSAALQLADDFVDLDFARADGAVTTDADGRFVLEGVRPGVVTVRARGASHLPTSRGDVRVLPAQHVDGLRLRADAGATLRVEVVDANGRPVEGADVTVGAAPREAAPGMQFEVRVASDGPGDVIAARGRWGRGRTDERGVTTILGLPAGDAKVTAKHADYAPSEPLSLQLPAVGAVEGRVVLTEPGFLEVRVLREDGAVMPSATVGLQVADGPRDRFAQRATTDADGGARFGPLAAGDYTAALSRGQKSRDIGGMQVVVGDEQEVILSSARSVTIRGGQTATLELRYPVMARVTGRVLGGDGPVAGCAVELAAGERGDGLDGFGGRQQKTAEDGTFAFDDVESGDYTLRFGKSDQVVKAEAPLTVPPNTPAVHRELSLRTGSVSVRVVSEDGEPVDRAEVRLARGGEGAAAPRRATRVVMMAVTVDGGSGEESSMMTFGDERVLTDEGGVARFEDVPVGAYTLEVEHGRHAPTERADVQVVESQHTDCGTLTMTAAGQIRGVVEGADGKRVAMAMVEYRAVGEPDWQQEMAMRAAFRLEGLKPGAYELRATRLGAEAGEPGEAVQVEVRPRKTAVQNLIAP